MRKNTVGLRHAVKYKSANNAKHNIKTLVKKEYMLAAFCAMPSLPRSRLLPLPPSFRFLSLSSSSKMVVSG